MEIKYIATINNPEGMHMRPAMKIQEIAENYISEYENISIRLRRKENCKDDGIHEADATSVLELASMAILYEDKIDVLVSGDVDLGILEEIAKGMKDALEGNYVS